MKIDALPPLIIKVCEPSERRMIISQLEYTPAADDSEIKFSIYRGERNENPELFITSGDIHEEPNFHALKNLTLLDSFHIKNGGSTYSIKSIKAQIEESIIASEFISPNFIQANYNDSLIEIFLQGHEIITSRGNDEDNDNGRDDFPSKPKPTSPRPGYALAV